MANVHSSWSSQAAASQARFMGAGIAGAGASSFAGASAAAGWRFSSAAECASCSSGPSAIQKLFARRCFCVRTAPQPLLFFALAQTSTSPPPAGTRMDTPCLTVSSGTASSGAPVS